MKKGIAIGIFAIASMVLAGCQQPVAPTTTDGTQSATTKATVKIEEPKTASTTGTLEILPAGTAPSEVNTTGSLEIKPGDAVTAPGDATTEGSLEIKPAADTKAADAVSTEGSLEITPAPVMPPPTPPTLPVVQ